MPNFESGVSYLGSRTSDWYLNKTGKPELKHYRVYQSGGGHEEETYEFKNAVLHTTSTGTIEGWYVEPPDFSKDAKAKDAPKDLLSRAQWTLFSDHIFDLHLHGGPNPDFTIPKPIAYDGKLNPLTIRVRIEGDLHNNLVLSLDTPSYPAILDPSLIPAQAIDILISAGATSVTDFGYTLTIGDLNNDGKGDLAATVDNFNSNTGRVYLFYQDSSLWGTVPCVSNCQASGADRIIDGEASNDYFGSSLAIGDLNNDGKNDLVVGAYGNSTISSFRGRAYIFMQDGTWGNTPCTTGCLAANADYIITGENTSNYFGSSLAIGDMNSDGKNDLVVGAYQYGGGGGRVYLFLQDSTLWGTSSCTTGCYANTADYIISGGIYFGQSLAIGDLSGDGKNDLAVGSQAYSTNTGTVAIFIQDSTLWGSISCTTTCSYINADYIITGEASNNYFGRSLAIGDLNTDGKGDLVVGADGYSSSAGRVYIFLQDSTLWGSVGCTTGCLAANADTIITGQSNSNFGRTLAIGDLDNDTYHYNDLAVGGYDAYGGYGRVYILLWDASTPWTTGSACTTGCLAANADYIITGQGGSSYFFGYSLAIGDLNNDGHNDLAVSSMGVSSTSRVYLFLWDASTPWTTGSACTTGCLAANSDYLIAGQATNSQFGYSLAIGDLNNDGKKDLAVSANGYSSNTGRVYLFLQDSTLWGTSSCSTNCNADNADYIITGESNSKFGWSLAIGDLNNDTHNDLVVTGIFASSNAGRAYIFLWDALYPWTNQSSVCTTDCSAANADYTITGEANSSFGTAVAIGDLDTDGKNDLAISANYGNFGRVYLLLWDASTPWTTGSACTTGCLAANADTIITGETNSYIGNVLAIGDLNNDGHNDLVASTINYNFQQGRVYLFLWDASTPWTTGSACTTGCLAANADYIITGQSSITSDFGQSVAIGDLNNDTHNDLAVGTYSTITGGYLGRIYIFLWDASTPWTTGSACTTGCLATNADYMISGLSNYALGQSLAIGDLNNDGKSDLVSGCGVYSNSTDGVYVFLQDSTLWGTSSCTTGCLSTNADTIIRGEGTTFNFGGALAIGDLSNDTKVDLAIGASRYSGYAGRAYIVYSIGQRSSVPPTTTVNNQAPTFATGPSDGGSSTTTPTTVGNNVTFTATATEPNHEDWYLAVCKTNSITPVNNAAPTCATNQTWAVSTATAYNGTATVTYATQADYTTGTALFTNTSAAVLGSSTTWTSAMIGRKIRNNANGVWYTISAVPDTTHLILSAVYAGTTTTSDPYTIMEAESNDWYAFECDKSSSSLCTAASQGTGDTGSPFAVNHAPTFGTVAVTDISGGAVDPGDLVKFTLAHPSQIADQDVDPSQDTVSMAICTSAATDYACTGGTAVCSVTGVNPATTDVVCQESSAVIAPPSATHGTVNFKVFVKDQHNLAGTGTNAQSFTLPNSAPTHGTPELAIHSPILANSVASWQFEDGNAATSFDDETTNANNGTCTSCPTWTQTGYSGGAYTFDGANNAITVPDSSSLSLTTSGAVSFWVNLAGAPSTFGNVFDKGNWGGGHNYYSCYFYSGTLRCDTAGASSTVGSVSTTTVSQFLNTWKYVVFTWDGSKQYLYVNGTKEDEDTQTQTPDTTGYTFNIGRASYAPNGIIDELNVYNRTLSAAEITALYNAYTYTNTGFVNTGLAGNWTLDDGASATSFLDASGNGKTGTCSGGACPTWVSAAMNGGGYSFNGVSNHITLPQVFSHPTEMTWSILFKSNVSNAAEQRILVYNNDGVFFRINVNAGTPNLITAYAHGTSGGEYSSSTTAYDVTQWHVITATAKENDYLKLYVDGQAIGSPVAIGGFRDLGGEYARYIGSARDSTLWANGIIDDVRIYNRALTAAEVLQQSNAYQNFGFKTTNMDLSAHPVTVADHDNDATTTIYNWKKNGASIAAINMPFDSNITSTTSDAVLDYSGNSNNGTLGGGTATYMPTWTSGGIKGGAYSFDGTYDYIQLNDTSSLKPNYVTVEAWVKRTGSMPSGGGMIFDHLSGTPYYGYDFYVDSNNKVESDLKANTLIGNNPGSTALQLSTWYHVAMTYDGANVKLYVNGSQESSTTDTGVIDYTASTSPTIGKRAGYAQNYFPGYIDEVRVYNRALSAAQIAQDYNNGKPLYNTVAHQELSLADTSWTADVTINDAQTHTPDSITKTTNAIDPSNSAPDQNIPSTRAHALVDANSVGYWQFEDGNSATSFKDQSASALTGSCAGGNCPTFTPEGAAGGGFSFDGTNDNVTFGDSLDNVFAGPNKKFTLSAFIKQSFTDGNSRIIIGKRADANFSENQREFHNAVDTGKVYFTYYGDLDGYFYRSIRADTTSILPNTWYQVTTVYDGSQSPDNRVSIYINGVAQSLTVAYSSGTPSSIPDGTAPLAVGAEVNSAGSVSADNFNGTIDEPHIYNRALSATEIQNLYNSTSYVYDNYDLGASTRSLSDNDGDALACTVDWRKNSTSLALLNMSFNKDATTPSVAVPDYSSYANNGTLGGGNANFAPSWTDAATCGNNSGGCYSFDGTNDYIALQNPIPGIQGSDYTISAWIKHPNAIGGSRRNIFDQDYDGSHQILLQLTETSCYARFDTYESGYGSVVGNSSLCDSNWHHLVAVKSGTSGSLYVDGSLQGSGTVRNVTSTDHANIGAQVYPGTSTYFFDGYIDEVQIFGKALSATQISTLYNAGKPNAQNLSNADTAVADLWSANMTCADASGLQGTPLTSNSVEILGFSTDVSDGGSSTTVPTTAGNNVTFTGTYNTVSGRDWYLAVCKTPYVLAGNNTVPQCCSDATLSTCDSNFPTTHAYTWTVSNPASDQAQASVNYTTSSGDVTTNAWYAFGCDKIASVASCSPASQGSGNSGSPFVVNHAPALGTVNIGPTCGSTASIDPGNTRSAKVITPIGSGADVARSVAIQSDGKVVLAGASNNGSNDDFALTRYNADGTLDTTFNTAGKVTTAIGTSDDYGTTVAIQSDGKIVAAGRAFISSSNDFALARYNMDGSLDTSFGTGGKVTMDFGTTTEAISALAIQSDGKIVAGGYTNYGGRYVFALARYCTDGNLDDGTHCGTPAFGTGGKVTTAIGSVEDYIQDIAIQTDGKIVAGGYSNIGGNADFALARYTTAGALDTTFNTTGKVTTAIGTSDDYIMSIALQSDGGIVAGGYANVSGNYKFAVARYTTAGALDTTFNTTGMVTTAIGTGDDYGVSVAVQTDGKIVLTGGTNNGGNWDFALARYTTAGVLDTTFNTTGKVTTAIGSGNDYIYGVALQTDGKIVAGGYSNNGSNNDFALVRYTTAGAVDDLSGYACVQAGVTDSDSSNTVDVYACDASTTGFNYGARTCTNGTLLCSITGAKNGDNAQCVMNGKVSIPTSHGSKTAYVYTVDGFGIQGTGTSAQSYSVTDIAPTVGTYTVSDIDLLAGTSAPVSFTVTITDNNGGGDLVSTTGVLYNSTGHSLSGGTCNGGTQNDNWCYPGLSCSGDTPTDQNRVFTCNWTGANGIWFNADASSAWKMHANPADGQGAVTTGADSNSITVSTLSAINVVESSIDYSSLVVGGTSAAKTTTLQNAGNIVVDTLIHGANMTSGGNTLGRAQQHWATSSGFTWGTGDHALQASDPTPPANADAGCANRSIAVATDHNTMTSSPIYWKLQVPALTPTGTYNGSDTFSSTANDCTGTD